MATFTTTDQRLDRLTVVEALAGAAASHDSVVDAHDRKIEALILLAEENLTRIARECVGE